MIKENPQPEPDQNPSATPALAAPSNEDAPSLFPPNTDPDKKSPPKDSELTPFMRQWTAAKRENPDALLFFRMGDFYELFYDDAVTASRELQLTLTARDRERQLPMCGVPYHAAENYLNRLLRKGYRVAICDQMEDPKLTKKIVRREVTRVLTPGTALDPSLSEEQSNYLAALAESADSRSIALLDVSTGEFRVAEFSGSSAESQAIDELLKASPRELLLPASAQISTQLERIPTRTRLDDWIWTHDFARPLIERQFNVYSLDGLGLTDHPAATIAIGAILHYLRTTQKLDAAHIESIRFEQHSTALELDQVTVRNLELLEPLFAGQDNRTTLFHCLDACLTPMGKRFLKSTILRPLVDRAQIESRYEAVAELVSDLIRREELRRAFSGILDLERLLARLSLDSAGPRDLRSLAASLLRLPTLQSELARTSAPLWQSIHSRFDPLADLASTIDRTLVAEPPLTLADGGAIANGINSELDDLRASPPPAANPSHQSKNANAPAPASTPSKSVTTPSSATTLRSPRLISNQKSPLTTSASKPSSTPSASPPPSSKSTKSKSSLRTIVPSKLKSASSPNSAKPSSQTPVAFVAPPR